ncbi:MAG TPA: low molecular weight protein-tyrosine-phosphatase [Wenzhouxiangellaceae bacterium]|nr:low molecular weight protein-tyrosine-phosphatase [Wenzhouxiangellaceae bacterium]
MSQRLLFVCMGNICRSPTAKGVFDRALEEARIAFESESAGTHDYHVGHPPDRRAVEAARRAGVDIGSDISRQFVRDDFHRFDRIFAMDRANLEHMNTIRPDNASARIQLVMELVPDYGMEEVPDPYYGGRAGFVQVIDMLEAAAEALVRELRS